jgi:hypothetical protein
LKVEELLSRHLPEWLLFKIFNVHDNRILRLNNRKVISANRWYAGGHTNAISLNVK